MIELREDSKKFLVKDKKLCAYCQFLKVWYNMTIMKEWINEVWRKHSHFVFKNDMMLAMDDASMYKINNVNDKIKECKTKINIIPGELTRYLQPLGVSISKPFND